MITLVRPRINSFADLIEDRLTNMVVAYEVEWKSIRTPYVLENDKKLMDKRHIEDFLSVLEGELAIVHSLSADACYVDASSGKIC
ncbi:MAG: hypothetical protein AAGA66_20815 [Bacteroidota bacterium]